MRRYLLDTTPLAAYLFGRPPAVTMVTPWLEEREAATSILVYGEVIEYLMGRSRFRERQTQLRRLLRAITPLFLSYSVHRPLRLVTTQLASAARTGAYRRRRHAHRGDRAGAAAHRRHDGRRLHARARAVGASSGSSDPDPIGRSDVVSDDPGKGPLAESQDALAEDGLAFLRGQFGTSMENV